MSLVTTTEMFKKSIEGKYSIGAFNINNMEFVQAIMDAAAEENSPVILQTSSSAIKYAGFTSVMFDGSKYDFEENVRLTKEVVDYAHAHGVVVEAEIGQLAGVEDEVNVSEDDAKYTNPDQAFEFAQRTGCDSLAIAIGTSHGAFKFKGEPRLRFDILEKIKEKMPDMPIVLHGASTVIQEYVQEANKYGAKLDGAQGCPDEMLHEASMRGVSKINVDTDLRLAMTAGIRKVFVESPEVFDPRKYMGVGREYIKETVKHKMRDVFGSSNKA